MKATTMISFIVAVVALAVKPTTAVAMSSSPDAQFRAAKAKGAKARVQIRVVDDEGLPVSNATVNAYFEMVMRPGGGIVSATTDTNGVAVVEGMTNLEIHYRAEKDGYYMSKDGIEMFNMSHRYEVKDGRWQPWGMQKEIVLRPVRSPNAIRLNLSDWRRTKVLNEWIGFDLEAGDYVAPAGKGKIVDLEVKFDWDGMYATKHNGMAVSLRFNDKFAGGYYEKRCGYSAFTGVYAANPGQTYSQYFHYYRRPIRDAKGMIIGVDGSGFDQTLALIVRSRCRVDENGKLVSARYFQIEDFEFSCTSDGKASLIFNLIYNPTPNDTNLEPK